MLGGLLCGHGLHFLLTVVTSDPLANCQAQWVHLCSTVIDEAHFRGLLSVLPRTCPRVGFPCTSRQRHRVLKAAEAGLVLGQPGALPFLSTTNATPFDSQPFFHVCLL